MNAEIVTIGDELLIGQVVNTNQAWIAGRLEETGVRVDRMTTVGDDMEAILEAFRTAMGRASLVAVTGGLGPTHDDITKKAVAAYFGEELVLHEPTLEHITTLLGKRNIPLRKAHEEQALVPRSARVLTNPVGTAPGMLIERGERVMVVMPGVPYEMKEIVTGGLLPYLKGMAGARAIRHRTLRTTGIPESQLMDLLGDLDALLQGAKLAFLPSPTGVRLRVSVTDDDGAAADRKVAEVEERIRAKAAKYVYGAEEEEIEEVLGRILAERGLTIAVAESCTGGLVANRLTNVSGSSAYVERCFVTYSNRSKQEELGVPAALIEQHGAVSREVAVAMAEGARTTAGTSIGLSTTGVAGPTGGTPEKPAGTVWIGCADASGSIALKFTFPDARLRFKDRASQAAMELVRRRVLGL